MKIAICGSIVFSEQMGEVAKKLESRGYEVHLPFYTSKFLKGEINHEESLREKEQIGDEKLRERLGEDLIKRYYELINESDAILVLNLDKKGIKNYIGEIRSLRWALRMSWIRKYFSGIRFQIWNIRTK